MKKQKYLVLCAAIVALFMTRADGAVAAPREIKSDLAVLGRAEELADQQKYSDARDVLAAQSFGVIDLEIQRLYLIAKTFMAENNPNEAIEIYRYILDSAPGLSKIRAELAIAYIMNKDWYRAEYHMRLALSDNTIPPADAAELNRLLYYIRKNKNWDMWFNFSAAPDSNPAGTTGGEECISVFGMVLCRQLPAPESAFGFHIAGGGNYEYRINEHWGIKSDAAIYTNFYDKNIYNDILIRAGTGPRYVWDNGEAWLSATANRRWYSGDKYSYAFGAKLDISQDLSNKVTSGITLQYAPTKYDEFGDFLNGTNWSVAPRLTWILNQSTYISFMPRLDRELTVARQYSNTKYGMAIGIGAELMYGFRIYVEPSLAFADYDAPQWTIQDLMFTEITEQDYIYGGMISISNNKLNLYDFTPAFVYRYTARDSNIWQRDFAKHSFEIQLLRRF